MSLTIEPLPSGAVTASFSGLSLHSRHAPDREAERYVRDAVRPGARAFIVLGSCLGYIEKALADSFPGMPCYSAQYDAAFRGREILASADRWYPDSGSGFDAFLLARLDPIDLDGLEIIDWPPAAKAYPGPAASCMEGLKKAMLSLNGSMNATQAFGPACLLNPVRNMAYGSDLRVLEPAERTVPVVIAASGPSLEDQAPEMRRHRGRYALVALSSAASALAQADLEPDFIVSSDPGYWARLHLERIPWQKPPVIFPLSANLPRGLLERNPLLPVESGSAYEAALTGAAGFRGMSLPPSGTVAATALDFALRYSRGPVLFSGLDLASRDILSHARPHAFDAYHSQGISRLDPGYSRTFGRECASQASRSGRYRLSPQFLTYYHYFSRILERQDRVYRLRSDAPEVPGLRDARLAEICGGYASRMGASSSTKPIGIDKLFRAKAACAAADALLGASAAALASGIPPEPYRGVLELVSMSRLVKMRKAQRAGDQSAYESALEDCVKRAQDLRKRIRSMEPNGPGGDRA